MKQSAQVMPMISVDSVDRARDFYVDKLGFSHVMGMLGKDGELDFCTVVLNGGRVMLSRAQQKNDSTGLTSTQRSVQIYFEVEDVKGYHDDLKKKEVRPTSPLTEQWWGDLTFTVMDPYGYVIWFYQTVAEAVPPHGSKIV